MSRHLIVSPLLAALCAGILSAPLMLPAKAVAHGGVAPPLGLWGPFGARTVHCLRVISRATHRCFREVLATRRGCADQQLAGVSCDVAADAARVEAAVGAATAAVDVACFGGQLTELYFASFDDAKTDIRRACRAEADAAMFMLYPSQLTVRAAAGNDDTTAQCMIRVSALNQKVLDHLMRMKGRTLERIAFRVLGPSVKIAMISRVEARAARVLDRLAARLHQECTGFQEIYGYTPRDLLGRLGRRGDCVVQATCFQTAISCPAAECGNGIWEFGEACDDGNDVETDECRSDCTLGS